MKKSNSASKENSRPRTFGSPGRRGWWLAQVAMVLLTLVLAGCPGQLTLRQNQTLSCSERRLDAAGRLFDEAKAEAVEHYRIRIEQALHAAFYASQDSIILARSIRRCPDFNRRFKAVAVDMIRSNILLQRVVKLNMRDPDPFVTITLLQDRYYEIFNSDIDTQTANQN